MNYIKSILQDDTMRGGYKQISLALLTVVVIIVLFLINHAFIMYVIILLSVWLFLFYLIKGLVFIVQDFLKLRRAKRG